MLLRLAKVAFMVFVGFMGMVGKVIVLVLGKDRLKKLVYDLLHDPELRETMERLGTVASLDTLASQMRKLDPQLIQWSEWAQRYGESPEPDDVPEYLAWVGETGALQDAALQLATAGTIKALCRRHPELDAGWELKFPAVFQAVALALLGDPDRAGWNDFYMAQWFVLRSDEIVTELMRRAELPGPVGGTCCWMLRSVYFQMPAFAEALNRSGYTLPAEGLDMRLVPDVPGVSREQLEAIAAQRGYVTMNGGNTMEGPPVRVTPDEERLHFARGAIIADCGPYRILAERAPDGETSHSWQFDIDGPGFSPAGVTVVGMDETCGRSIIGGLCTAWRAGRMEGRILGRDEIVSALAQSDDPAVQRWAEGAECPKQS